MQPVNQKINLIVYRCLSEAVREPTLNNELNFVYTDKGVPESGKAIHAMWQQAKHGNVPFKVFNGANAAENLYFSPRANLLYRAVHDVDHAIAYSIARGTTKYEDELYLNCLMAKRVYDWCTQDVYYTEQDALLAFFAMYHDTVGQVHYYKEHGDFVVNQRANTVELMNGCKGVWATKHGMLRIAYTVMRNYLRECGLC